ncbi:acyltransferase [Rivularia sp. UHCC 0363]|uniref:acyltransferase n=1 Tax=Rivularia sp. UHCC 0363 TaxID=3110244 RepID=UPI002B21EDCF|nr:acyltransferase [Rivularia sp. UHCC 0363]MEA5596124.1 acyltransferase [Rivularia sp. UHCC 0363]
MAVNQCLFTVSMKKIYIIYKKIKNPIYLFTILNSLVSRFIYRKKIWLCQGTHLRGIKNITTNSDLVIGLNHVPFYQRNSETYINVEGCLVIENRTSIARGAIIEVSKSAKIILNGCSVGASKFLIKHQLEIGEKTLVSWGCEFLDNNIHHLIIDGKKKNKTSGIKIGNHCWIGSNCTILADVVIPDGCVVATGSIVTKAFEKENCLIGGSPAKIIKEGISWEP